MKPMWMVRAGREGRRFEQFIEREASSASAASRSVLYILG